MIKLNKTQRIVLLCAVLGIICLGLLSLLWIDPMQLINDIKLYVNELNVWLNKTGPFLYFAAMSVLPLFGFPILPLYIMSGAFGKWIGLGGAMLALSVNLCISYFLCSYLIRPWMIRLLKRFNYEVPVIKKENESKIIWIFRITPGIPFFVQNYILGVAGVSFYKYLFYTLPVHIFWAFGAIFLGESIMNGDVGYAIMACMLIISLKIGISFFNKPKQKELE